MSHTDYYTMIDKLVVKKHGNRTPKPFKSGHRVNRVKSITVNPHTGRLAFTFYDDDSVVECRTCQLYVRV